MSVPVLPPKYELSEISWPLFIYFSQLSPEENNISFIALLQINDIRSDDALNRQTCNENKMYFEKIPFTFNFFFFLVKILIPWKK